MKARILIIEDNPTNMELMAYLLHAFGHTALRANNGEEGVATARRELPDLIICDIHLPKMDGYGVLQQLKSEMTLRHIPVIAVTALAMVGDREKLLAAGFEGYIGKPIEPEHFVGQVEKFLINRIKPLAMAANQQSANSPDKKKAILIVDDRAVNREFLAMLLGYYDFQILEADNGVNALKVVRQENPLLVITDVLMPVMDGIEFVNRMHADPMISDIPVIFYTATYRLHEVRMLAQTCGVSSVLSKPVDPSAIIQAVSEALGMELVTDKKRTFTDADFKNSELEQIQSSLQEALVADVVLERQSVVHQLQQSEAGLRRAQLMTKSGHIVAAPDGTFENWSETLPGLIGVTNAEMPANLQAWLTFVDPLDRTKLKECYRAAGKSGARMEIEYRVHRKDGTIAEFQQVIEPLQDQLGPDVKTHWFNSLLDITEQKEQQKKITRLNRISSVLSGINSAIMRLHDRQTLFEAACRIAVNQGAFDMAWVGSIDSETLDGEVVCWFGGKESTVKRIEITARSGMPDSRHPACIAAREMKSVICNDIRTDPALAPYSKELLAQGYLSLAALPLIVNERVAAVITLMRSEANIFDDEELKLLNELAGDLAFGLQFIEKEEKLTYLGYYDALTGLPNHILFNDRLMQMLQTARSTSGIVGVIMLNLDRFSELNDSLGRHIGDELLRQVAKRLRPALSEHYSLARIDSDIFAIAVHDLQQAADAATMLKQQVMVAFKEPFHLDQQDVHVTARAGLAMFPDDGSDADTLLKHAKIALNKTKSSDEPYLYFAPQMNSAIATRMAIEKELRVALDADQFTIYYQPRVNLRTGHIVGAEALIRWNHPQRGIVLPQEFIAFAEENNLIEPIGAWAINTVCAQQVAWQKEQVSIVPVAVNLSTVQFKKGAVLQTISEAFSRYPIDRANIEFEITESVMMSNPEEAALHLQKLKRMGVKLSLDDFGTGYSSLAYLKRFPFDFVKIDRTFVTDITTNPEDATIATAVIAMAHSLGLCVIAEGVETKEQLDFLRRYECDEIQGHHFSRPVPAAQFKALLLEKKQIA